MARPQSEIIQKTSINPKYHLWHPNPPNPLTRKLTSFTKDMELRPMENLTNPDEECFNESLLTLVNGQQDLQKQSLNMIQDITHR